MPGQKFVAPERRCPKEEAPLYRMIDQSIYLQAENLNRPGSKKNEEHLQAFLDVVRSLGVSLRVWKMGMDIAAGRGEKDPAAKASRSFRQDSASREGYKDKKTMGCK